MHPPTASPTSIPNTRPKPLPRSLRLGLTAVAALVGFTPDGASAAPADAPGWVEGVVVGRDGKPVAGALVNALGPAEVPERGLVAERTDRRTTTAADGSFRVRQPAGGYLVQVCAPDPDAPTTCRETAQGVGFAITYVGGSGTTDSWVTQQSLLPATPTVHTLGPVTVKPLATVAGTLAGARKGEEVRLMRLNDTVAFRTWTDAQGRWALDGVVPGRYYVAAGGTGELPWESTPVELVADQTRRVDATLQRGAVMHGRVVARQGRVGGTEVLVRRPGQGLVASSIVDRDGRFEVGGLVPGRYVVEVPGGSWRPRTVSVRITGAQQVVRPVIRVQQGATLVVDLREGGRPAANVVAELRDRRGRPMATSASDDRGRLTFTGLTRGRWTVVAAGQRRYGKRALEATATARPATVTLDQPFLTLRGRTAARAVVEATTGDFCPPDRAYRVGGFHEIVRADAHGRYRITRLVPGRYMLGADGWPGTHAPRCWSDVDLRTDTTRNLPLQQGVALSGRLVYADTSLPVITPLSYELFHRPGSTTNPTEEHPARARTLGAIGTFEIRRLSPGVRITGRLAKEAGEGINDESFFVTFPFQDGTPYWLDTAAQELVAPSSGTQALGDIPVTIHGR